jgi:dTDP-4-dehydrorhamnose reductase
MKVVVVGSKGMLGRTFSNLLRESFWTVINFDEKWPTDKFYEDMEDVECDAIVNCVVEKGPNSDSYLITNYRLPIYLYEQARRKNVLFVHVGTDVEFSGNISSGMKYSAFSFQDPDTQYGRSKALATTWLSGKEDSIVFRTSIIGEDHSFFDDGDVIVRDDWWSGVTVLQLAKEMQELIISKTLYFNKCRLVSGMCDNVIQIATEPIRKSILAGHIKNVFKREGEIFAKKSEKNFSLQSAVPLFSIEKQLVEYKEWLKTSLVRKSNFTIFS